MRTGFLQFDVRFGDPDWNRGKISDLIARAEADLLVLPELCISGYLFSSKAEVDAAAEPLDGRSVTLWKQAAARRNLCIVAGIAEQAGGKVYNSAVLVRPSGEVAVYRKTHLFQEEKRWFEPGDTGFNVFDIGAARVGIMVCFDWIFPESCRTLALKGADIVCHPANLVLPYCQDAMVTRCIENRVFSVTANRIGIERRAGRQHAFTGRSRIVGPFGQVLAEGPGREESVEVVTINPADARDKSLGEHNHLLNDRRPALYELSGPA